MSSPVYAAAAARADKLLEPDGSIQTHTGTVVSGPSAAGAAQYSQASARADKLLQPDGSIITSGSGTGGSTPPGGATGQVQYNNAGTFAGAADVITDGTKLSVVGATGNGITLNPAAAGAWPTVTITGTDTTAGLSILTKGTGALVVQPGSTLTASAILQLNTSTGAAAFAINLNEGANYTEISARGAVMRGAGSTFVSYSPFTVSAPFTTSPTSPNSIPVSITTVANPNVNYMNVTTNGQSAGDILHIDNTGATYIRTLKTAVYTVATLPAATAALQGVRALVTDATAPTFLGTLTGGGSVICPVFCTGSAWLAG